MNATFEQFEPLNPEILDTTIGGGCNLKDGSAAVIGGAIGGAAGGWVGAGLGALGGAVGYGATCWW